MDGMKSGAGDDPFADADDDRDQEIKADKQSENVDDEAEPETPDSELATADESTASSGGLPWIYARDSAKAERDMVQFFLQKETKHLESYAEADLEERLGENIRTFDVREAAYQVALEQHLNDVEAKLREWGYDYE